jgi:ubiquinone/menaquinone biosynthesis C-methylase UbiE
MYNKIIKCRACNNKKLSKIVDLGKQPLANALLKKKNVKKEIKIPLELCICDNCKLVQLKHTVNPKVLFQKYIWVTGTSDKVKKYREIFFNKIKKFISLKNNFICEIASNDGFFLESVKKENRVIGIDPAKNIAKIAISKGIKTHVNFFNYETAKKIKQEYRDKPNLIICRNVIPHIENIQSVMKGLHVLLSDDGLGVIEFHYAKNLIFCKHYDYIYHEHIYYFTMTSLNNLLKRFNLYGFDYFESPISGGSLVILFKKKKKQQSIKFKQLLQNEKKLKLNSIKQWRKLKDICLNHKKKLNNIIEKYSLNNKIAGYGASARSSTLTNYIKLNNKIIEEIFDLNPMKHNLLTPGSHILIKKPDPKLVKNYDVILLLAWNFKKEVLKFLKKINFKGQIILPLPNIRILKNENKKNKV